MALKFPVNNFLLKPGEEPTPGRLEELFAGLQQNFDFLGTLFPLRTKDLADQENWKAPTLLNSFVNYETGGVFEEAAYRRGRDGRIHLRGLVKRAAATGTLDILNLPVGMRPSKQKIFTGHGSFGAGATITSWRIDVAANGNVGVFGNSTNCDYLSLAEISFYPD